ncbi:MAG: hypothetical protein IMW98_04220 [Firmicutes bacterium]|nr:hypothetical protein [Bacillota bacterium]
MPGKHQVQQERNDSKGRVTGVVIGPPPDPVADKIAAVRQAKTVQDLAKAVADALETMRQR